MTFIQSHVFRCVAALLIGGLLWVLAGCGGSPQPTPPTVPAGSGVSFRLDTDETATYDLSVDQADMFIALINSPPTSLISPDDERPTAMPPGIFVVDSLTLSFHGSVHFTNQDGYTFVWAHPFFKDHLWLPPSEDELPDTFEKMSEYEWPGSRN